MFPGLFASQPFFGIFLEKTDKEIFEQRWKLAEILVLELDFFADYIFNCVAVILFLKRCEASYELVEGYSHSPAVDFFRVTTSQEHLRCLIDACPCIGKHLLVPPS